MEKRSFDCDQKNNNSLINERNDSSIIEKIDTFRVKLRFYRNFGDAIFIRIILVTCSTFFITQWCCFMKENLYLFIILFNLIIIIDGIYILVYRKV